MTGDWISTTCRRCQLDYVGDRGSGFEDDVWMGRETGDWIE
jgi:hypothetical protein